MSINRRMDKEDVVYICNGILLRHKKNKITPFSATQIDLEIFILSEVSQRQKDKYNMISLICGIQKKKRAQMNFFYKTGVTDVENKLMVTR